MENLIIRRYNITHANLMKEPIELPKGARFLAVVIDDNLGYDVYVHVLVNSNTKQTEKYDFRLYWIGRRVMEIEIQKGFTYLESASIKTFSDEILSVHVFYRKM